MTLEKQLRAKLGVDKKSEVGFEIQYGHTETHIVLNFGQLIDNLTMTLQQAQDMEKTLGKVRAVLKKHQEKKNV